MREREREREKKSLINSKSTRMYVSYASTRIILRLVHTHTKVIQYLSVSPKIRRTHAKEEEETRAL